MHILPIVTKLLRAHPQLDVHLILVDRVIRLVEEGIDVAVRIADLSDSSLHAIRVAEVRRVLVASPAYLAERGLPAHVSELVKHDLIAFDSFALNGEWRFTFLSDKITYSANLVTSASTCCAFPFAPAPLLTAGSWTKATPPTEIGALRFRRRP